VHRREVFDAIKRNGDNGTHAPPADDEGSGCVKS
jgi:hypothetical protein